MSVVAYENALYADKVKGAIKRMLSQEISVVVDACGFLLECAKTENGCARIIDCEGVEPILTTLKKQRMDNRTAPQIIDATTSMLTTSRLIGDRYWSTMSGAVDSYDIIDIACEVIKAEFIPKDKDATNAAIRLLTALATGSPERKERIDSFRGINVVFGSLSRSWSHISEREEDACRFALEMISGDDSLSRNRCLNIMKFPNTLCNVLIKFGRDDNAAEICELLSQLTLYDAVSKDAAEYLVETAQNALEMQLYEPDAASRVCALLNSLIIKYPLVYAKPRDSSVPLYHTMYKFLSVNEKSSLAMRSGFDLLTTMVQEKDSFLLGFALLICHALAMHVKCAETAMSGCRVLRSMATYSERERRDLEADVFSVVRNVFLLHSDKSSVMTQACALVSLLSSSETYCDIVVENGSASVLLNVLETHIDVRCIADNVCETLLSMLTRSGIAREFLAKRNITNLVHAVKKKHDNLESATKLVQAIASPSLNV